MSNTQKMFIVSDDIYWGYKFILPFDYIKSITKKDIIKELKEDMKNFFGSHNLEYLKNGIDNLDLHIDMPNIEDNKDIVYICSHKH